MNDINTTKLCSKCKQVKARSEFHKDRRTASGYAYNCKACKLEYDKPKHAERRDTCQDRRNKERKRVAVKWRKWLEQENTPKQIKAFEMQRRK